MGLITRLWCRRANRRSRQERLRQATLALTLLAALPGAAAAQTRSPAKPAANPPGAAAPAQPTQDAERYERCIALAHNAPADAFTSAEAWRATNGGFPAAHCAAIALIGLKRYDDAARRLEALAGAMMGGSVVLRAGALGQAGQAWLLADRPTEAKAAFDAALSLAPNDPDLLIDRARAFAEAKKFWDAIDDLNRVIDLAPDRYDALIYRASAYREVDNGLDLALDDVQRALKLAPDAVPGLLERGNIRRLKGDMAGAREDWQRVLKLAPSSPAGIAAKDNLAELAEAAKPGNLITTAPQGKPPQKAKN